MVKTCPKILHHADTKEEFYVFVDSSQYYYAGVLLQRRHGKFVIIDMFSKIWKQCDVKKHITTKELLAMVECMRTWHHYLIAGKFIIHSDSRNIKHLFAITGGTGKPKRSCNDMHYKWVTLLAGYSFQVKFIQGIKNYLADYYSRWINTDQIQNWEEGDRNISKYNDEKKRTLWAYANQNVLITPMRRNASDRS